MAVNVNAGGVVANTAGVTAKPAASEVSVPIVDVSTAEHIACGFRQHLLDLKNDEGDGGEVSTGAGLGNEFITLAYAKSDVKKTVVVRGSDLLIAWIETFDPEMAAMMRKAVGR